MPPDGAPRPSSGCERPLSTYPEQRGHSDQVSNGPCFHLLHHYAAMNLHADLAHVKDSGNLLVHQARGDQREEVTLARRRSLKTLTNSFRGAFIFAPPAVVGQCPASRHRACPDPETVWSGNPQLPLSWLELTWECANYFKNVLVSNDDPDGFSGA